MDHPKVDIVWSNDGWNGVYIDGECKYQGHSLGYQQVLEALGIEYTDHHAHEEKLEDEGCLPEQLTDLVEDPEED